MTSYPRPIFTALASTIDVDPAGDLKILVNNGEQQVAFRASSKVMSLASPVWRTMLELSGPFEESQPKDNEISFPEDDAEALLILLLAAHLRNQDVPQELWYEQLMNVCILYDKYNCIGLVRPWISRWQARDLHLAGLEAYDHWLIIAWTTGDEETFERLARHFVNICKTKGDGAGGVSVNWTSLTMTLPPGLTGQFIGGGYLVVSRLTCW